MEDIVENFKIQYASMATRSRDEAERWYQKKVRRTTPKIRSITFSVQYMSVSTVPKLEIVQKFKLLDLS